MRSFGVAVVDEVADKRATRAGAQGDLDYLYTPEGQELAARHAKRFPQIALFTIDDVLGGWAKAQKTHFADGGVFDQIHLNPR